MFVMRCVLGVFFVMCGFVLVVRCVLRVMCYDLCVVSCVVCDECGVQCLMRLRLLRNVCSVLTLCCSMFLCCLIVRSLVRVCVLFCCVLLVDSPWLWCLCLMFDALRLSVCRALCVVCCWLVLL